LQRQGPYGLVKLPLKCHSDESRLVAQHTTSATIQGRAGYVQQTLEASASCPVFGCLARPSLIANEPCGSCVAAGPPMSWAHLDCRSLGAQYPTLRVSLVGLNISSNRAGVGTASSDANGLPHPSSDQRQYCTIPASFPLTQPDLPFLRQTNARHSNTVTRRNPTLHLSPVIPITNTKTYLHRWTLQYLPPYTGPDTIYETLALFIRINISS
jgi:hypothetical protein